MNADDAARVQRGASYLALYLHNDTRGADQILDAMRPKDNWPYTFVLVALTAAGQWSHYSERADGEVWAELRPPDPSFPAGMVDRDAAVRLARAIKSGNGEGIKSAATGLDRGIISISTLDLALAVIVLLTEMTGRTGTELCQLWALGVAAGEAVDDP